MPRYIDASPYEDCRIVLHGADEGVPVKDIPTADVQEVRHGKWEWLGPNRLNQDCMCGTCSVCKIRSKYITNKSICPNCGAKMDGEEHEKDT